MSLYPNFFSTVIAAILFQGFITSHPNGCRRKERRVWVAGAGRKEGREAGGKEGEKGKEGTVLRTLPRPVKSEFLEQRPRIHKFSVYRQG